MRKPLIGVIDYGMGNLHSVAKAIALQGGQVFVSDSKRKLSQAQMIVLPGVGSFGAAVKTLAKKKLDSFVQSWLGDSKPYLGICLGIRRGFSIILFSIFRPFTFKVGQKLFV